MLRVWGWGWVLLVCWTVGCGSSDAEPASAGTATGGPWGGQTGSLAPNCGPGQSFDMEATLPTGDAAFVYYDTSCTAEEADFGLSDADGEPIAFHLEELPGGGLVVKAETALTPGDYTVSTPQGTQTVTVTQPEPVPTMLGALSDQSSSCATRFRLAFSDEVIPYLPLLSLRYSVDGGESQSWFDYGTLNSADQSVQIELGRLARGPHELEIHASIAGETAAPDVLSHGFESSCEGRGEGGGGCAVVAARPFFPFRGAVPLGAALLVLGSWRRRCRVR